MVALLGALALPLAVWRVAAAGNNIAAAANNIADAGNNIAGVAREGAAAANNVAAAGNNIAAAVREGASVGAAAVRDEATSVDIFSCALCARVTLGATADACVLFAPPP